MKTLSVVSPCYNEEANLNMFFNAVQDLREWCMQREIDLEVIIVDDSSKDDSRRMIEQYCGKAGWVRAVFNARNLGVYRTSYHGLRYCTGQWIVPMFPVDLQDPPDVLKQLIESKVKTNAPAVMGKKVGREESPLMAASRKLFYLIVSNLSSNKLEKNAGEFGVLERWIVDECVKRDDYYPFLRGMIANVTDEIVNVDYVWKRRTAGVSKHNLVLLYDHAINGLISTGRSFIRPIVVLGLVVGTSSFLFALTNLVLWIFMPESFGLSGLPTLIVGLFFLLGLLLVVLGLLGEYIYAVHAQVRGADRPIHSKLINIDLKEGSAR
jgi:glycosyltransferase involved in cell wall biosynthesis